MNRTRIAILVILAALSASAIAVAQIASATNFCAQATDCQQAQSCNLTVCGQGVGSCAIPCSLYPDGGGGTTFSDGGTCTPTIGYNICSSTCGFTDGGTSVCNGGFCISGTCVASHQSFNNGLTQACSGPGTCGLNQACVSGTCQCGGYGQPCCYGYTGCAGFPDGGLGASGYGMVCGGAPCQFGGGAYLCCGGGQ